MFHWCAVNWCGLVKDGVQSDSVGILREQCKGNAGGVWVVCISGVWCVSACGTPYSSCCCRSRLEREASS